ncbi:MAG: M23 family metallopeptidase [Gemmatimonadaceae bacterium]|nr:M23 family metallopeptidase [Gemmatimonadaceae bacterium]
MLTHIGPGRQHLRFGPLRVRTVWRAARLLAAFGVAGVATTLPAQVRTRVVPTSPRPGTLFRIMVGGPDTSDAPTGTVAGEPLHFARDSARWVAWAAAPVDSSGAVHGVVAIGRDTVRLVVPLAPSPYRVERLSVAPRFGREPDSATARRIAREFADARAVSRRAHETPRLFTGAFARPRPGRVTSGFGNAREFNGAITSRHTGVDYAGAVGSPVRAAQRGVVRLVGAFYYAGNVVYVDHGVGMVTAYFHLARADVLEGDTVRTGQVIGRVGATGRVTGPHLHFVARYGEISVDGRTLPGYK